MVTLADSVFILPHYGNGSTVAWREDRLAELKSPPIIMPIALETPQNNTKHGYWFYREKSAKENSN